MKRTLVAFVVAAGGMLPMGGGAAPPEPAESPSRPLLVVVPVDYEPQIRGAVILAESLRAFGGDLRDLPIRLYAPSRLEPMLEAHRETLAGLRVEVRSVEVPPAASRYVLGAKPFTAAQAERDATGFERVAILAPNTIVLGPPAAFLLPPTAELGYSTVHHQNVGSLASEPPDAFWSRIYSVLGISPDGVLTNWTLADDKLVRLYFNAGSFVVRPEHRLLERWAEAFQKLMADATIAELCANGPRNVFLHQAALAGAALASLRPTEIVRLPDTYSYPLFFERFHGGLLTFDSLEGVVTMRYEFRVEDLPEAWESEVAGPPEVLAWIKDHLAPVSTSR